MRAPCARAVSSLERGASLGITMVAGTPVYRAAIDTAMAWLPDEKATTPRGRSAGGMERIRLDAPRILNAPPVCRFSHLKKTRVPAAASKSDEAITGVRLARGRMRAAAARTWSAVMGGTVRF